MAVVGKTNKGHTVTIHWRNRMVYMIIHDKDGGPRVDTIKVSNVAALRKAAKWYAPYEEREEDIGGTWRRERAEGKIREHY